MSIAAHKERALAFLTGLGTHDLGQLPDMLADDFAYEFVGRVPGGPVRAGKREFLTGFAPKVKEWFPNGLHFRVMTVIGEGPHVAVQAESNAVLADGRQYGNQYHFYFRFEGGKIVELREYLDVVTALDILAGHSSPPA
ncbi:MAG: nuclear transport factor 2 family protein [Candidatus Binatia bacterium]